MTSFKPTPGPLTTPTHTTEPVSGVRPVTTREEREAAAREEEALAAGTAGLSSVSQGHAADASVDVPVARSTGSTGGGPAVNLVDLAKQVEAGQLTMGQAVERLVEGTIGSLPRQLTDLERAELTSLLRSAVSSDPSMRALQDDSA